MVLARPVTAVADHGSRHDGCQAAAATEHEIEPSYECPAPAAAPATTLPAASQATSATAPPATAAALPPPAARPPAPMVATDPRSSLIGGAALAGLALLMLSGFRARRRLRQGWDEGASDPGAL